MMVTTAGVVSTFASGGYLAVTLFFILSGFVLWLNWIMRMMQLIDSASPTDAEVDAQIQALKEGSLAVPNFRERLN